MASNEPKRGFLIMPFNDALDPVRAAIDAAGTEAGVTMRRADDIFTPGVVLEQIIRAIDEADVVVAVCTGRNANVFFELGYAWRRHDPILVAGDTDDLPFDVAHYRAELYGRPNPNQNIETLTPRLVNALRAVLTTPKVPIGRVLQPSRAEPQRARLAATLQRHGSGSKLIVSNPGAVDVTGVDVTVPTQVGSLHLLRDGYLPIEVLRPGERVEVPAIRVMGGGPSVFDITLSGETPDGTVSFPSKLTL